MRQCIAKLSAIVAMIVSVALAAAQESDQQLELSPNQQEYLRSTEGDWALEKVLIDGHKFDMNVPFDRIRVSRSGIALRDSSGDLGRLSARYSRVDAANNRIDLTFETNDKSYLGSACLKGDQLWLVFNADPRYDWPDILESFERNRCYVFVRPQEQGNWCGRPSRNNNVLADMNFAIPDKGDLDAVRWRFDFGQNSFSSPVVVGSRVYLGAAKRSKHPLGEPVMQCIDLEDGRLIWEHSARYPDLGVNVATPIGVSSSPCIVGDRLIYVGPDSTVYCIDRSVEQPEASVLFAIELNELAGVEPRFRCAVSPCSPVSDGQLVFVANHRFANVEGVARPHLFAIDLDTGKVVWSFASDSDQSIAQLSSPSLLMDGRKSQVVFGDASGVVYGFLIEEIKKGNQTPHWTFRTGKFSPKDTLTMQENSIVASPVMVENQVFVATGSRNVPSYGRQGVLWCIDPTLKGDISPFQKDVAVQESGDHVDKQSGAIWSVGPESGMTGSIANPVVGSGVVIQATQRGDVFCVDRKSGTVRWKRDLQEEIWGTPSICNGQLTVVTESGRLHVFEDFATSSVSRIVDLEGEVFSTACIADDVLLIVSNRELIAIEAY